MLSDITSGLEEEEISLLLDRAMSLLPDRAREILVDRYMENRTLAEIAQRRGIREDTANVQLHRGRLALRRVLTKPGLREEAIALGIVDASTAGWQITGIWCPHCGSQRLEGYFGPCSVSGHPKFVLECPGCGKKRDPLVFMVLKPGTIYGSILDGVQGFKPGLNRVLRWWEEFTRTSLEKGASPCMRCGRPLPISLCIPDSTGLPYLQSLRGERGILALCDPCKSFRFAGIEDISFHHPSVRDFWKRYPRMRTIYRTQHAHSTGHLAITRFESVVNSASIEVVHAMSTMKIVDIFPGS
jgi:hypothetical protein